MRLKRIFFALTCIFCPFLLTGQTEYNQYFDGADTSATNSIFIQIETDSLETNIWQIGEPKKTIFNAASTLPNAIVTDTVNYYPINNSSSFSFGINDLYHFGPAGILAIQWMQKLDMDKGFDGGIIEYSSDTGQVWTSVFNNPNVYSFYGFADSNKSTLGNGSLAFTGTDTTWKNIWLCFDVSWLSTNDTLEFRFRFESDSVDNNKEGWIIDNLKSHITYVHTVAEHEKEEYMTIGPNPTRGRVDISTKKSKDFHIIEKMELVDLKGAVVQTWQNAPTKYFIDIAHHPDGIYFLNVQTNKRLETFKLILNH
jgi:hypothetical protein